MPTISEWQNYVHETAKAKGWHDKELTDDRIAALLCLVHSEVSEALEDVRRGRLGMTYRADGKPEGLPSELADVVIRVMDMCGALSIDLESAIERKHAYNGTRSHKHGGKLL